MLSNVNMLSNHIATVSDVQYISFPGWVDEL